MSTRKTMVNEGPPVAVTEGGRRPTGVTATGGGDRPDVAVPAGTNNLASTSVEVVENPQRRRFARAYKLDILRQADTCSGVGEIGALLRREGLYSSYLAQWRLQRDQGLLDPAAKKRKRAAKSSNHDARVTQLERENARLQDRLRQAELILDIQKKASEILGIPLKAPGNGGNDS